MWLLLASPLEGLGHGSSQKAPDKHWTSKIGGAGAKTKQKGAAGGVGQGCPSLVLIYWLRSLSYVSEGQDCCIPKIS